MKTEKIKALRGIMNHPAAKPIIIKITFWILLTLLLDFCVLKSGLIEFDSDYAFDGIHSNRNVFYCFMFAIIYYYEYYVYEKGRYAKKQSYREKSKKDGIILTIPKRDKSKTVLIREQIVVLANQLRKHKAVLNDCDKTKLAQAFALITGYSDKQLRQLMSTETCVLITDKNKIQEIQDILKNIISDLEKEKENIG